MTKSGLEVGMCILILLLVAPGATAQIQSNCSDWDTCEEAQCGDWRDTYVLVGQTGPKEWFLEVLDQASCNVCLHSCEDCPPENPPQCTVTASWTGTLSWAITGDIGGGYEGGGWSLTAAIGGEYSGSETRTVESTATAVCPGKAFAKIERWKNTWWEKVKHDRQKCASCSGTTPDDLDWYNCIGNYHWVSLGAAQQCQYPEYWERDKYRHFTKVKSFVYECGEGDWQD